MREKRNTVRQQNYQRNKVFLRKYVNLPEGLRLYPQVHSPGVETKDEVNLYIMSPPSFLLME